MKQASLSFIFLSFLLGDTVYRDTYTYCSEINGRKESSFVQFAAVIAFQPTSHRYHTISRNRHNISSKRSLCKKNEEPPFLSSVTDPSGSRKSTSHGTSRSHFLSTLLSTPALVVTTATLLTAVDSGSSKDIANAAIDLNPQQPSFRSISTVTSPSSPSLSSSILLSTTDDSNTFTSSILISDQSSSDSTIESTSAATSAIAATTTTWEQSLAGLISGLVLTACKTTIKYPADTAVVRLQMPNSPYSIYDPFTLFRGCFQGLPAQLAGTLPSGAIFFAVKDAVKAYLNNNFPKVGNQGIGLIDWDAFITTSIAVGVAQPPYWLIRNPSEVIKTREQVSEWRLGNTQFNSSQEVISETSFSNTDDSRSSSSSSNNNTFTWDGIKDLYSGYWENVFYAYPADLIKFAVYEVLASSSLQKQRSKSSMNTGDKKVKIGALEGAIYGAFSTALAQGVTTPLDVVRNRIMVKKDTTGASLSYIETLIDLGRKEGMKGLFAGAGLKVAKAIVSGGIQFAAYETTNQSIQNMLEKKKSK